MLQINVLCVCVAYIAKFVSCKAGTSFNVRVVDLTTWGLLNNVDTRTNLDPLPLLGLPAVIHKCVW